MDEIFEQIGSFKKYQKLVISLATFTSGLIALNAYVTVFTTAEPKLLCKSTNGSLIESVNQCELLSKFTNNNSNKSMRLGYECEYDRTYYGDTIITEWNLICDRSYLVRLTQSIYMFGSIFSLFTGYMGDRWGRERSIRLIVTFISIVLFLTQILMIKQLPLSINVKYVVYCINKFSIGFLSNILYSTMFVLVVEITTQKHHTKSSITYTMGYILGESILLIVAYFFRDWRTIYWINTFYALTITILCWLFIPESPRWLMLKERYDEADAACTKIAKINNRRYKKVTSEIGVLLSSKETLNDVDKKCHDIDEQVNYDHKVHILKDLFCVPKNALNTIFMLYIFLVSTLLYYGISFGLTKIDTVNPYYLYLAASAAEASGYFLCFINEKIGRKKSNIIFLSLSSLSCLGIGLLPTNIKLKNVLLDPYLIITFTSIGKCMISAALSNLWIYMSELYATTVRNTAILLLNSLSRVGSLLAPMILLIGGNQFKLLPYIIFGCASVLAVIFACLLPETLIRLQNKNKNKS